MEFDMGKHSAYREIDPPQQEECIRTNITQFVVDIREKTKNADDLVVRRFQVGAVKLVVIMFEGQISNIQVSDFLLRPLTMIKEEITQSDEMLAYLRTRMLPASDQKEIRTYSEVLTLAMSGFAVVMVDGCEVAFAYGYQGFSSRSVGEPTVEKNLKGSKEAFCEVLNTNVALVRRRIKSPDLVVEVMTIGALSNTKIKLLYIDKIASKEMVKKIKERIAKADINMLMDSGYLRPFIEDGKFSLFSGTGETERPDTLCSKINEGRIGILVDGSPFAVIVPYLFVEHFQTADDYMQRPYFATFIRSLKFLSFFATIFLPGYYVAVVTFHYELIPEMLLNSIVQASMFTPLAPVGEALLVFILYELLREAGLRLPTPIGHAISVVGGLVIGDAAVTAGLVGLPMIILIAITAISAFVIPSLYEPVTTMRFVFIIVGGVFGLYGVYLGMALFLINLCSIKTMDVPITSPASPFDAYSMRDMLVRSSWKKLGKKTLEIEKLPGSDLNKG